MSRMQTLQTLLEREQARRDEAQSALQDALRQAQAALAQENSLVDYRGDYCKRWAGQFAQSGAIEILRCYQGFVERLDQAIGAQAGQVRASERAVEAARQLLLQREMRLATVERLMQRHAHQQKLLLDRREQKNIDEMAMRRRPASAMAPQQA